MTASIRGHQTVAKFFKEGELINILTMTSFEANQDSNFSRSYYVGNPIGEGDQTIMGWSGTAEVEVKGAEVDELIDGIVTQNLAGIGVSEYTLVDTEFYADGTKSTYVYSDVQMKMTKRASGLETKVTKSLQWQASSRIKV